MYKKFALILFSATGALALQATAATAGWVPYGNTNPITSSSSSWKCGATRSLGTDTNVGAQVCTVRSANREGVRGAIIVRNNNNYLYSASAKMTVYYDYGLMRGEWSCSSSGVGANSWSVCFGTEVPAANHQYFTGGYAKNTHLGITGNN